MDVTVIAVDCLAISKRTPRGTSTQNENCLLGRMSYIGLPDKMHDIW